MLLQASPSRFQDGEEGLELAVQLTVGQARSRVLEQSGQCTPVHLGSRGLVGTSLLGLAAFVVGSALAWLVARHPHSLLVVSWSGTPLEGFAIPDVGGRCGQGPVVLPAILALALGGGRVGSGGCWTLVPFGDFLLQSLQLGGECDDLLVLVG